LAQPECARCKDLEGQAHDLLGQLKVANLKWSVAHPWVGLTDEEINACDPSEECWGLHKIARDIEQRLKEKNT